MDELIWVGICLFLYILGMNIGERIASNSMKRKLLYLMFDWKDEDPVEILERITTWIEKR